MTAAADVDMTALGDRILAIAVEEGIPVLGIADAEEMEDEPPGARPSDLVPDARSLLVFGLAVPAAVYQTAAHRTEVVWRTQNIYYRRLDQLSLRFAALLEERGERSIPVFGCMPMGLNARGEVNGFLNQLRMGEVAGIGLLGRNGLLLHPRFGARLMLGGVVTTAPLPALRHGADPGPGCPPDCRICVDECPVGAISLDEQRVKITRCLTYTSRTPLLPKLRYLALQRFNPQRAERLMNQMSFDEHTLHVCNLCVSACPYDRGNRLLATEVPQTTGACLSPPVGGIASSQ